LQVFFPEPNSGALAALSREIGGEDSGACFLFRFDQSWIAQLMKRLAAGNSYSGVIGLVPSARQWWHQRMRQQRRRAFWRQRQLTAVSLVMGAIPF
jgi:hypothetical protein